MAPPRFLTPFETLANAIACQQVGLSVRLVAAEVVELRPQVAP